MFLLFIRKGMINDIKFKHRIKLQTKKEKTKADFGNIQQLQVNVYLYILTNVLQIMKLVYKECNCWL